MQRHGDKKENKYVGKEENSGRVWWLMCVIPALWDAKSALGATPRLGSRSYTSIYLPDSCAGQGQLSRAKRQRAKKGNARDKEKVELRLRKNHGLGSVLPLTLAPLLPSRQAPMGTPQGEGEPHAPVAFEGDNLGRGGNCRAEGAREWNPPGAPSRSRYVRAEGAARGSPPPARGCTGMR
ncbi:hypothetical protein AAY473_028895 [Plecturocebus cupreus]